MKNDDWGRCVKDPDGPNIRNLWLKAAPDVLNLFTGNPEFVGMIIACNTRNF
jgi:hypothetical protein